MGHFTTQTSDPTGLAALLPVGFLWGGNWVTTALFPAWPKPEAQLATEQPHSCVGSPGLGPLSLPAGHWHIQSHHSDAIVVLTLAPESIKHLGKVQSSSWAWQAPEEV